MSTHNININNYDISISMTSSTHMNLSITSPKNKTPFYKYNGSTSSFFTDSVYSISVASIAAVSGKKDADAVKAFFDAISGVASATVSQTSSKPSSKKSKRKARGLTVTPEILNQIIDMSTNKGMTTTQIGNHFNITHSCVARHLRQAGYGLSSRSKNANQVIVNESNMFQALSSMDAPL